MSKWVLKLTVTAVPSGSFDSSGRLMSRLWPAVGGQPKSLPDCDHHRWVPGWAVVRVTFPGSITCRGGSLTMYALPFWVLLPVKVYGVPSGCCQWIVWVFIFESGQLVT